MQRDFLEMSRILNISAMILNVIVLSAVIWIVVPAPFYNVWLFSVAASEWSLWFGALGLIGVVCSLFVRIFYGNGHLWIISIILGSLAVIISLYPLISVISTAREFNISLSLKQYFSGVWKENNPAKIQTFTFAHLGETDLQLDVYSPSADSINNGASVIIVHGGSWNGGGRNDFPQWNRWLAEQGFTVFDIDYRLVQPNYLTATGDVKCAVRWVKENAAKFKISPERSALLGRSAGAHLALLAAYSADDARFPASCIDEKISEDVRAVISFHAPTDLLWDFDNPANQSVIDGPTTLTNFLGGNPHESDELRERFILASPVAHVDSATPPTLLIHGGQDQLVRRENMKFLAGKLTEANVPHETLLIPYAQHGFDYNFNGWGAQTIKPVLLEFLRKNTNVK